MIGINIVLLISSIPIINAYLTSDLGTNYCNSSLPTSCPSWSFCNTTGICQCYQFNYLFLCQPQENSGGYMSCNCLTFDSLHNITEAGSCILKCELYNPIADNPIYMALPRNITQLNKDMCGRFSRTGTLCGKCIENTYTQVYSYNLTCIPCDGHWINVLKYVTSAFAPLTLFYILILLCSTNLHSSRLQGFVLFAQVICIPILPRITILNALGTEPLFKIAQCINAFYGIWSLDFSVCLTTIFASK